MGGCEIDQPSSSEHAEENLRPRQSSRSSRARNQRTGDHGPDVAPPDVRRLGDRATVSGNRDVGRKDCDAR